MAADPVRLLHRVSGYTSNPRQALFAEPEAVSEDVQRELTRRATSEADREERIVWRSSRSRLLAEVEVLRAQRFRRDVESDLRVLVRTIDKIDAKLSASYAPS